MSSTLKKICNCSKWVHAVKEDDDEEFSTSLSVGDGRYLVDLGRYVQFHREALGCIFNAEAVAGRQP